VDVAATALLLASLWPTLAPSLAKQPVALPHLARSLDALLWLRDVAPPTSHYDDPHERAEYGVLSSWVWGHFITAISHKPNVASPLGQSDANLAGVRNSARFLLATSEREGVLVAESLAARFVLLTPLHRGLESMVLHLGHDMDAYATAHPDGRRDIDAAYLDTLHSQLYLTGPELPPGERLRLVYEGHATQAFLGQQVPYTRIFELVRGVTLTGTCPGAPVAIELELRSDAARDLFYRRRVDPRPDGRFAVLVPYATDRIAGGVTAKGPMRVVCGEDVAEIAISHTAVTTGATIDVRF
jgi:asparagine N-glycosylation enzyme membrane subunit Stt3